MLSIVIPIHNEDPSVLALYDRLTAVLEPLAQPYEIIFVDDASTDRSFELLTNLLETDSRLKVVRLRRNFGQTAALSAGFHEAQGDVVISLDGESAARSRRHPGAAGQDRGRVRYRQRLAKASGRSSRAKASVPYCKLAYGQSFRYGASRFRHDF